MRATRFTCYRHCGMARERVLMLKWQLIRERGTIDWPALDRAAK